MKIKFEFDSVEQMADIRRLIRLGCDAAASGYYVSETWMQSAQAIMNRLRDAIIDNEEEGQDA